MDTHTQSDLILAIVVVVLGAAGTYLLLPHRHGVAKPRTVHVAGAVLAGLGLLLFATFWRPPGPFLTSLFFYAFGLASVAGGLLDDHHPEPDLQRPLVRVGGPVHLGAVLAPGASSWRPGP